MSETDVVVGGLIPYHEESTGDRCAACGAKVWISPALQDRVAAGAVVNCEPCAFADPETRPVVSEATLVEVAERWGCTVDAAFARCAEMMRQRGKTLDRVR